VTAWVWLLFIRSNGPTTVSQSQICGSLIAQASQGATREFHKVISKSKLPMIRLHDLRHCVASNLLNNGYSPTDVAGWLGHSSPVTTFGYYAHASKASKENISNAVQGWFGTNPLDNR